MLDDEEFVGALNVTELRAELGHRGLPTQGLKAALAERLREALIAAKNEKQGPVAADATVNEAAAEVIPPVSEPAEEPNSKRTKIDDSSEVRCFLMCAVSISWTSDERDLISPKADGDAPSLVDYGSDDEAGGASGPAGAGGGAPRVAHTHFPALDDDDAPSGFSKAAKAPRAGVPEVDASAASAASESPAVPASGGADDGAPAAKDPAPAAMATDPNDPVSWNSCLICTLFYLYIASSPW